ncbi:hypothetical protein GGX14DRAFT_596772 [Mycena pura]|uniref:Uncharacterized protein n=1 Tax=Mycena pura TaxID=153505 RepID=A0AAD6UR48_9AGAR|nr:hypothetical protein GGX14DRAFT_596772 [Mycena pura]
MVRAKWRFEAFEPFEVKSARQTDRKSTHKLEAAWPLPHTTISREEYITRSKPHRDSSKDERQSLVRGPILLNGHGDHDSETASKLEKESPYPAFSKEAGSQVEHHALPVKEADFRQAQELTAAKRAGSMTAPQPKPQDTPGAAFAMESDVLGAHLPTMPQPTPPEPSGAPTEKTADVQLALDSTTFRPVPRRPLSAPVVKEADVTLSQNLATSQQPCGTVNALAEKEAGVTEAQGPAVTKQAGVSASLTRPRALPSEPTPKEADVNGALDPVASQHGRHEPSGAFKVDVQRAQDPATFRPASRGPKGTDVRLFQDLATSAFSAPASSAKAAGVTAAPNPPVTSQAGTVSVQQAQDPATFRPASRGLPDSKGADVGLFRDPATSQPDPLGAFGVPAPSVKAAGVTATQDLPVTRQAGVVSASSLTPRGVRPPSPPTATADVKGTLDLAAPQLGPRRVPSAKTVKGGDLQQAQDVAVTRSVPRVPPPSVPSVKGVDGTEARDFAVTKLGGPVATYPPQASAVEAAQVPTSIKPAGAAPERRVYAVKEGNDSALDSGVPKQKRAKSPKLKGALRR